MTKLTLSNLQNLQNESTTITNLTQNNAATVAALENTLSLDGTSPNSMKADFDMNSNRILNLPDAINDQEPATFSQLVSRVDSLSNGAILQGSYVTVNPEEQLSNERVLTGSSNIGIVDTGAGGEIIVSTIDPELNALAATTSAADQVPYFTGAGTANTTTLTSFARTLIGDADAPSMKTTLVLDQVNNTSDATKNAATATLTNKTIDTAGPNTIRINGNTLSASAGTATVTVPASTDTLVARNTTDTLTNKTLDTAGPNVIKVNGNTLAASAGTAIVTIPNSTDTLVGRGTTDTLTNKTLTTPNISSIVNTGTLTLPTSTDTLVGRATTDTLTNKTISGSSNTLSNVALTSLSTQAANTLLGNVTGSSASPTAFTIGGLTQKSTPTGTDLVLIQDQAASGTLKFSPLSSISTGGGGAGVDTVVLAGYITGLTLSTAGSSSTFSVASGAAIDSTSVDNIKILSSYNKTTGAWAVGSGNGALDTGTIAASTWYHVYIIKRTDTGVTDILISLSATSPTMPTNYTLKRRIGSMLTNGSSQWTLFTQLGNDFIWNTSVTDVNGVVPGVTTSALRTLTVPTGFQVVAKIRANSKDNSSSANVQISSPDEADQTVFFDLIGSTGVNTTGNFNIRTNTSGQIRTRQSTTTVAISIWTYGWTDLRGKL